MLKKSPESWSNYLGEIFESGIFQEKHAHGDRVLLGCVALLLGISILMVYSTTAVISFQREGISTLILRKHLMHIILGLIVFFVSSRLNISILRKLQTILPIVAVALLVFVLLPGLGRSAGGARRWISLGIFNFQPGELAKLATVFYFAGYIARHEKHMLRFLHGAVMPLVTVGFISGLLLLQPDFGTSAIITIVTFFLLLTVSKLKHLGIIGLLASLMAGLLVFMAPYRMQRLKTFLDPFAQASSSGYQLVQSLIAVGSGGLSGAGIGAGEQKLFYLPAAHTDFIFAVIAEELGFYGSMAVIILFLIIAYRGIKIALAFEGDIFRRILSLGCTLLLVIPCFLNIAVVTGLLPTKGLVLPLIAYGGSAMLVNLGIVGLLYGLSRDVECESEQGQHLYVINRMPRTPKSLSVGGG